MSSYDKRSADRTARKRCGRCGDISWVRPRVIKCKRLETNAMGRSGFICNGELTRAPLSVVRAAVAAIRRAQAGLPAGAAQMAAARKAKSLRTAIKRARKAISRAQGRVRRMEARAEALELRAKMTDEQIREEAAAKAVRRATKMAG